MLLEYKVLDDTALCSRVLSDKLLEKVAQILLALGTALKERQHLVLPAPLVQLVSSTLTAFSSDPKALQRVSDAEKTKPLSTSPSPRGIFLSFDSHVYN